MIIHPKRICCPISTAVAPLPHIFFIWFGRTNYCHHLTKCHRLLPPSSQKKQMSASPSPDPVADSPTPLQDATLKGGLHSTATAIRAAESDLKAILREPTQPTPIKDGQVPRPPAGAPPNPTADDVPPPLGIPPPPTLPVQEPSRVTNAAARATSSSTGRRELVSGASIYKAVSENGSVPESRWFRRESRPPPAARPYLESDANVRLRRLGISMPREFIARRQQYSRNNPSDYSLTNFQARGKLSPTNRFRKLYTNNMRWVNPARLERWRVDYQIGESTMEKLERQSKSVGLEGGRWRE